jgi:hypothetical protein
MGGADFNLALAIRVNQIALVPVTLKGDFKLMIYFLVVTTHGCSV